MIGMRDNMKGGGTKDMYTKQDIMDGLKKMGLKSTDTLLVHSSMKAIGEVEGGADTVLDAFMEYMKEGLLIFPTHTWDQMNETYNSYDYRTEPSCVGLLTNLFRLRDGVVRSLHPTHSVAAYGVGAMEYISGEENMDTPCSPSGCWGKLYDKKAKILFLGCSTKRNTFLHCVEEMTDVPGRLSENRTMFKIILPIGEIKEVLHRRHIPGQDVSQNYDKMLPVFLNYGYGIEGKIGDAQSYLCDAVGMAKITSEYLKRDPMLFDDGEPIPVEWYL